MPLFTVPTHESNDCHAPAGTSAGGEFCGPKHSAPGKGVRPRPGRTSKGDGYQITMRSQDHPQGGVWSRPSPSDFQTYPGGDTALRDALGRDGYKVRSARVVLRFDGTSTAHLGAPIRWKAPNGVEVLYKRGQRRGQGGGAGVYHDFNVEGDEYVVPLTRNIGAGRRALRAWAKVWITDITTARFRARQLVRPGD